MNSESDAEREFQRIVFAASFFEIRSHFLHLSSSFVVFLEKIRNFYFHENLTNILNFDWAYFSMPW